MSYQHKYVDGTNIHFPLGKVVCIGRNYAEHAKELDNPVPTEPLLFIKPGSCVVALEGGFAIPIERGSVHYEAEIAPRGSAGRHLRLRPGPGPDPAGQTGRAESQGPAVGNRQVV